MRTPARAAPHSAPQLKSAWNCIMRRASPPTPAAAPAFMAMSTRPAATIDTTKKATKTSRSAAIPATAAASPHRARARARNTRVPQRSAAAPLAAAARPPTPTELDSRSPSPAGERWRACWTSAAATAHVPQNAPKTTNTAATARSMGRTPALAGLGQETVGVHHHPGHAPGGDQPVVVESRDGEDQAAALDPLQGRFRSHCGTDAHGGEVIELDPPADTGLRRGDSPGQGTATGLLAQRHQARGGQHLDVAGAHGARRVGVADDRGDLPGQARVEGHAGTIRSTAGTGRDRTRAWDTPSGPRRNCGRAEPGASRGAARRAPGARAR